MAEWLGLRRVRAAVPVLSVPEFRALFSAATISMFGDGVAVLAVTFAVLDFGHSATALGLVLGARTMCMAGCLLVGGAVGDRMSRVRIMILADGIRFLAQGAVGMLIIAHAGNLAVILVAQALVGGATGFFNPASSAILPAVAGQWLQQANSLKGLVNSVGIVAGPAVAGILVVTAGPGVALIVDAVSYGLSAVLLARLRIPSPRQVEALTFIGDLVNGFTAVRTRSWLWRGLIAFAVINAAYAALPVLGSVEAKTRLGGPGAWALLLAAQGVGSIAAASTLLRIQPSRPLRLATSWGVLAAVPLLALAVFGELPVIAIAMLVGGFGTILFNTLWETTLQSETPAHERSKVASYDFGVSLTFQTVGLVLVGSLASAIGNRAALLICGLIEAAAILAMFAHPATRNLRSSLVPVARTGPGAAVARPGTAS